MSKVTIPTFPFESFPKIPRLKRSVCITEKIDGTNASVFIPDSADVLYAASRNRWISHESDNAGFARWCNENYDELLRLGPGHHFGEWWGAGIQRRYGVADKRFWLFNVDRWNQGASKPSCVGVVPVIYRGDNMSEGVEHSLQTLRTQGSLAAPGFMNPEGIVVFHYASRSMFKVTLDNDAISKSEADRMRSEKMKEAGTSV